MPKLYIWLTTIVCLTGVILLAPLSGQGQAQGLSATFFIAHAGAHEDASVLPIIAVGGRPVSFEVRVRDAGTTLKAGWQARLVLDACRFETPAPADVRFGDFMLPGSLIPVGPKIEQKGNSILHRPGTVYFERTLRRLPAACLPRSQSHPKRAWTVRIRAARLRLRSLRILTSRSWRRRAASNMK